MTDLSGAPRRRWFTLSIRVMMCLVLVMAVLLGYVVQRARAQRQAVAEIQRLHGIFSYDWRRWERPRRARGEPTRPDVAKEDHR